MTNRPDHDDLSDTDLDLLLAQASQPDHPAGAMDRLLAKSPVAVSSDGSSRGVARVHWLSAVPLAASLLIGVFLGSTGFFDVAGFEDTIAVTDESTSIFPNGFEEIEQLELEDVT
jgi:hypothetical protein